MVMMAYHTKTLTDPVGAHGTQFFHFRMFPPKSIHVGGLCPQRKMLDPQL